MYIPFCPLPVSKARKLLGSRLYGLAEPFAKIFPSLELELRQADFDLNVREYISIALFSSFFMFILTFSAFFIFVFQSVTFYKTLSMGFFIGSFFLILTFFYIKTYPKLVIRKKVMDLERNLIYAVRHIYVQVTSGVPIFDAMLSVSEANYGTISKEFKIAVRNVNTGQPIEKALDDLALRNPSQYFRRTLWQISNGIKSGSDIGNILRNITDYISSEQKILIKLYGSQLNPLTLLYMMAGIVIPSLGITFLVVLSSFSGIPVTETMFWIILAFLLVFQFMFLGMIKSKRPNLI